MARSPSPRDDARRRSHSDDDDGAPWLDEAEYDDGPSHTLIGRRTTGWIVAIFAVLVLGVVVGILLVSKREATPIDVPATGADIAVLTSPGPWKTLPDGDDAEGQPVEGQGQILFDTGQGREPDSRIDINTLPEDPLDKPMARPSAPPPMDGVIANPAPQPTTGRPPKVILPEAQRQDAAPSPALSPAPPASPATAGGATVQLGAFSTSAKAMAAFRGLAARFDYLAGHEPVVMPTERDGKTLYRLRVVTSGSSAAKDICDRLKLAGEACTVVR